jgi:hypothetical protein
LKLMENQSLATYVNTLKSLPFRVVLLFFLVFFFLTLPLGIREGYEDEALMNLMGKIFYFPVYAGYCAFSSGWWAPGACLFLCFLILRIYFSLVGEISLFHYGQICCASFLITVHEMEDWWWIGLIVGLVLFACSNEFVFRKIKPLPLLETKIGNWFESFLQRREEFSRPPSDEELHTWKQILIRGAWIKAGFEFHEDTKHSFYVRTNEELIFSEKSGNLVSLYGDPSVLEVFQDECQDLFLEIQGAEKAASL